jgi:uncharacterized protein (TIGR00369 family)
MDKRPLPDDVVVQLNQNRGPFTEQIGLEFVAASYDRVEATVPVTPGLHQPHGLVHGGVYAAIVEAMASAGSNLWAMNDGKVVVGLENTTSFLRAVRDGTLHVVAHPLQSGRRTHVWAVEIAREGKLVARGQVRCLAVEPGSTGGA